MAGHQVCEVPEALCGVTVGSDVDVHSAHVARVALCFVVPELSDQFLQAFNVLVGEDRGDHLAFLIVPVCKDAAVSLELPFPAPLIPCAPGLVSVAVCCVFVSAGSEEGGCGLCCVLAADAVHLNLYSDGLVLHGFDLCSGAFFHGMCSFRVLCFFPFGSVLITLKHTYIQSFLTCNLHKDFPENCALFGLIFMI